MSKILGYREIPTSELVISDRNVRKQEIPPLGDFEESIKEKGILQPVIVREKDGKFEVIAGQLRVLTAQELGLEKVPAIIKEMDDTEAVTESLIENVTKNELNPDEEAEAVAKLCEIYKSQRKVAEILGKNERWIRDRLAIKKLLNTFGEAVPAPLPENATKIAEISRVVTDVWEDEPDKIADFVEKVKDEPREKVRKILNHVKLEPEKDVDELLEEAKKEGQKLRLFMEFPTAVSRAILKCAGDRGLDREEVISIAVEQWLKKEGYL